MIRSDAKTYVARALSGSSDSERLAQAQDSISAAIEEWNLRNDWSFLLQDTSGGFTVAACTLLTGTLTTTTTNGFAGVNVGQTATGTTIGTVTVTAINSVTSLTVTGGADNGPESLTFSADIPVLAGVDTYNLPYPIRRPYGARLITNPRRLEYREQSQIDRAFNNLTIAADPSIYNLFNSTAYSATRPNGKIRLFPVPGRSDTLRVRYFTNILLPAADGDTMVIPDRYLYSLLELGKYYFLKDLDSENPRTGELKERSESLLRRAIWDDRKGGIDNDMTLVPLIDHGVYRQVDSDDVTFGGRW
jgi:hypothetical protein